MVEPLKSAKTEHFFENQEKNSSKIVNYISRIWNALPDTAKEKITLAAKISAAVVVALASIALIFGVDTVVSIIAAFTAGCIALAAGMSTAFILDKFMPYSETLSTT
jgi:hypothetical protein